MFKLLNDIIDDIVWPSVILVAFWVVFLYDQMYGWNLNTFGLRPMTKEGLIGVFSMPFLHGDLDHLLANSIPFFVSSILLFHLFPRKKWAVLLGVWISSGLFVWFIGDPKSIHVGASGVVYGLIAFLLTAGLVKKSKNLSAVAMLLVFLYGGLIWGVFPEYGILIGKNISWEGHLAGALSGIVLAIAFRKYGPEDDFFFQDEDEDDEDDDDPNAYWKVDYGSPDSWTINYTFRDKEPEEEE